MPISDIVFQDAFTDTGNTRLDCHTPDVGEGWCCLENTLGDPSIDYLKVAAGGTTLVSSDGEISTRLVYGTREFMPTPDVQVRIAATTVPSGGGDDPFWLLARVRSFQNLYGAGSYDGGTQCIYKKVAGVSTQIATLAGAIANGDYFEFYLLGSRLELHKNGTLVLGGSDSAISEAGRAGFAAGSLFVGTDDTNTGYVWDDYSVRALRHLVRADGFTDADGTNLFSHFPDQGGMWVLGELTDSSLALSINSNRVGASSSSLNDGIIAVLHPQLSGCEYAVQATLPAISTSSGYPAFLVARLTNATNYYTGGTYRAADANDKRLYKTVAGVYTLIAQADAGLTAGDVLRLEVENGAQRLYLNDTLIVSGADTALTQAGSAGIGLGILMANAGHVDFIWKFDDFKVYLFGGPLSRDEGGIAGAIREVSAATVNVNSRDHLLICQTNSNAIAVNLPPAGQKKGREIVVKNIGSSANDGTLDPDGSEQIDGAGSVAVADGESRIIRSTGTAWYTVAIA